MYLVNNVLENQIRAVPLLILKFTCWRSSPPTFWSSGITLHQMLENEWVTAIRKFGSKLPVTM